MAKGGEYERELCKRLSLWWTGGERDDVFWRTSQSGGRATTRNKTGKKTFGQCGDICAVDPIGQPLMRVVTIEAKRGYRTYAGNNVGDAFDRTAFQAQQTWEAFVEQAETSAKLAGSLAWMLVQRRDERTAVVFFPRTLFRALREQGAFAELPCPSLHLRVAVRVTDTRKSVRHDLFGTTLDALLKHCTPQHFTNLAHASSHS